jgi:hypothetical protein
MPQPYAFGRVFPTFLIGEEHAAFALLDAAINKLGGGEGLAGTGGSGNQDDGIAEEAPAAHFIQLVVSGADAEV